jgi:nucleoside-diphosphate-sugar epimerase
MKVFVTGASGGLAAAVLPELVAAGHTVTGLARSDTAAAVVRGRGADVVRGDLSDLDVLRAAARDADGVVHLAFDHGRQTSGDLAGAVEADLRAIGALGEALRGTGKPLVGTNALGALAMAGATGVLDEGVVRPDGPRIAAENALLAWQDEGVRTAVVRLPPAVHHDGRWGFVSVLLEIARARGASGYLGDGSNRWPAVHAGDAARLYRLALEGAPAGTRWHAVADEGIPLRDIAVAVGDRLGVPVAPADAADRFGFLEAFVGLDVPASSAATRASSGWTPEHPGLLAELGRRSVLNVGLDPAFVPDPARAEEVRVGLARGAHDLAQQGMDLENCLLDGGAGSAQAFRAALRARRHDVVVIGGGVRLVPAMTPLLEELVDIVRTEAPASALGFNDGPDSIPETVARALDRP